MNNCIRLNQLGLWVLVSLIMGGSDYAAGAVSPARLSVDSLRCEYRVDPVGTDVLQPRLSWVPHSNQRGDLQTAYQILAASDRDSLQRNDGNLWDSGRVVSDQSTHVRYMGKPLGSRAECHWKVRIWNKDGQPTAWSKPSSWTMGLLHPSDWKAQWINDPRMGSTNAATLGSTNSSASIQADPANNTIGALPATMLRKAFMLDGEVRRAAVYATALGLYELHLNGQHVGNQLLAPEWTNYRKRIQYQTYDVTQLLHPGENVVAALLGEGWYAGRLMVVGRFAYGACPKFLAQLEIEYADGHKQTIATDDTWHGATEGPIRSSGIYDGEVYDARFENPGWDLPGFKVDSWKPVQCSELGSSKLVWQPNEPIRVIKELVPVKRTEPRSGTYVFDLGQNMVGWGKIRACGIAGQPVTIRHAEMLNDDGTLYVANLRGAPQIDRYIPKNDGPFDYEPRFTYHGFRYIELTGLAEPPPAKAVLGRVFCSSSPEIGSFECSDPSINQLMRNILWTQRANLMSSPNDCPQRDERFGWMGDIQAFGQTALFNMDLAAFFTKWLRDLRDDQADDGRFPDFAPHPGNPNTQFSGAPAWADAGVMVPWCVFLNTGDRQMLEDHFQSARRWVDGVRQLNPDLVWTKGRYNDYNDWLNGDWIKQKDWPAKGASVPNDLFATAFFARSTELVARMAQTLGLEAEARHYAGQARDIKAAFNRAFVEKDGRLRGDTQAGYALALSFDLLPVEQRPLATSHLVEGIHRYQNHLSTGIQTTHRLMEQLTCNGHHDLAWLLLTNRTFPSWLYMIDNGATTIWERWDGYVRGRGFQDAGMNSFNHWAFGAVGEWIWRHVGGLNPDESRPGFQNFIVAPMPGGGITWAKCEHQSIRGPISIHWRLTSKSFRLRVHVPMNTTATVRIPTSAPAQVRESHRLVSSSGVIRRSILQTDAAIFELPSGEYEFQAPIQRENQ